MRRSGISPVLALSTVFVTIFRVGFVTAFTETPLRMPGVTPPKADTYLCLSAKLDPSDDPHYIVGFKAHGSMATAHHILVYGCAAPGSSDEVWNCGEMKQKDDETYDSGPVCSAGSQIIYAWAKDAPELKLPDGVGFKVGGDSGINYLVVQIHYMHHMEDPDYSGVTLNSTVNPMPKRAGVLLMVTDGELQGKSKEHFETACVIDEPVELHPFAFRTHTHEHGQVVSGWKVTHEENGVDKWELIGKKSPQLPQMFYPVEKPNLVVKQNDIVAARCLMENTGDKSIRVGATGVDEMCNFYMMYYVNGDQILSDNICFSPGPPNYYWKTQGGFNNIPDKEADNL